MFFKLNTAVWLNDNSVNKQTFLAKMTLFSLKMTTWHAHVVHMAKHMNMVGGPGPGTLGPPPKSGAEHK